VAALLTPKASREFLYFYLTTQTIHLKAWVSLGAQPNLNTQIIGGWPVVLPPSAEQDRIVEYVKQETSTIMRTIDKANHEVKLLHEYRSRLIADVVTGKLDVREAAAQLPDEAEEPELLAGGEAVGEDETEGEGADLDALSEEAVA
jgi:type I restriction enzyme S subunit